MWSGKATTTAAVHLMRWWQLFPKIFLHPYLLRTCLKSILIVGVSWKITQVTRMPARLIFFRSEEGALLEPQLSTLSECNYLFWNLLSHLLILQRILISKQGLRPNIKVQAFVPIIIFQHILLLVINITIHVVIFIQCTKYTLRVCLDTAYC